MDLGCSSGAVELSCDVSLSWEQSAAQKFYREAAAHVCVPRVDDVCELRAACSEVI